jgi:hypothetical protein
LYTYVDVLVTCFGKPRRHEGVSHGTHLALIYIAVERIPAVYAHGRRRHRPHRYAWLRTSRRRCALTVRVGTQIVHEWARRQRVLVIQSALRVVGVRVPHGGRRCAAQVVGGVRILPRECHLTFGEHDVAGVDAAQRRRVGQRSRAELDSDTNHDHPVGDPT